MFRIRLPNPVHLQHGLRGGDDATHPHFILAMRFRPLKACRYRLCLLVMAAKTVDFEQKVNLA